MAMWSGIAFEEKPGRQRQMIQRTGSGGRQKHWIDRGDEAFEKNDILTGNGGQRIVATQRHARHVAVPGHDVMEQRGRHF
jgi:hypothetical protein